MEFKDLQDQLFKLEQEKIASTQLVESLKTLRYKRALKEIRSALANPIY